MGIEEDIPDGLGINIEITDEETLYDIGKKIYNLSGICIGFCIVILFVIMYWLPV